MIQTYKSWSYKNTVAEMKRNIVPLLALIVLFSFGNLCCSTSQSSPNVQSSSDVVIAFGSCNRTDLPQPLWNPIVENSPDLWIWLGDNIYGDSDDEDVIEAKYNAQLNQSDYKKLMEQCPIVGIWDDHDYGLNDGGKEFHFKDKSKTLMFDFLGISDDHPARDRKGAYMSHDFTWETKNSSSIKVKVILLDSRYFRDEIDRVDGVYKANEIGEILGAAQWAWFEKELNNSEADVNIIANGIQFLPEDHRFEKWANFPQERDRLLELLSTTSGKKTILLSGDRHIAEISKMTLAGGRDIFEITSSGLTHSYEAVGQETNRHRAGKLIGQKNFGLLKISRKNSNINVTAEIRGEANIQHDFHQLYE